MWHHRFQTNSQSNQIFHLILNKGKHLKDKTYSLFKLVALFAHLVFYKQNMNLISEVLHKKINTRAFLDFSYQELNSCRFWLPVSRILCLAGECCVMVGLFGSKLEDGDGCQSLCVLNLFSLLSDALSDHCTTTIQPCDLKAKHKSCIFTNSGNGICLNNWGMKRGPCTCRAKRYVGTFTGSL